MHILELGILELDILELSIFKLHILELGILELSILEIEHIQIAHIGIGHIGIEHIGIEHILILNMLSPDISQFKNSVHPDQLVSEKPTDQDPHCLPLSCFSFWFDLVLYVPVNNLSVTIGRVFLGGSVLSLD